MKHTVFFTLLALVAGTVFAFTSGYTPYDESFDVATGDLASGVIAYRLVHEALRSNDVETARAAAEEVDALLTRAIESGGETAQQAHLYLAHMYLELIIDAATWFAYQPRLELHRSAFVAHGGNGNDLAYLEAKKMLLFPPSMGGDPERAREILTNLAEYDDQYEAEYFLARSYLLDGDAETAFELLAGYPGETLSAASQELARRLEIEIAAPRIRSVSLESNPRAANPLVSSAILLTPGAELAAADSVETLHRLGSLPGVSGASVEYDYDQARNEVDVFLSVTEGSQRIVGAIVSSVLVSDIDRSQPITPALIYMDENLLGRGVGLSVVTAGIFWQLGVTVPLGEALDLRTGVETMLIPLDGVQFYGADGESIAEQTLRRRTGSASIGGVATVGPLQGELEYRIGRELYERDSDSASDYVLPDDLLHRGTVRVRADTSEEIFNGAGIAGFRVGATFRYEYYSGFDAWGTGTFRNEAPANGLGTGTLEFSAAWGRRIGRRTDAGVHVGAVGGGNYYTRSIPRLGAPGFFPVGEFYLRGYPANSIEAERAAVAHVHAGVELLPGSLHLSTFYDGALVDAPDRVWGDTAFLNAAGIALAAKLPWSLDLAVRWAHGFGALDGSTDAPSDMLTITVTRLTAF